MRAHAMLSTSRAVRRQGGFSLIELMISIVIGFAVIGALLLAYTASVQSGRNGQAVIQMTEDASAALNLMRAQLAMAGYGRPAKLTAGKFSTNMTGNPYLFGCDAGTFADPLKPLGSLSCSGGTGPDALAVSYEVQVDVSGAASAANGVVNKGVPYDCIGNALTGPPYIADSHFYVAKPGNSTNAALYCSQGGKGTAAGQPVAENVVDLQVKYLMQNAPTRPAQVVSYLDIPGLTPAVGVPWSNVVAVRLCVEVVSTTPMTDANANYFYVDCTEKRKQSTDGRLHRSFTTTVALQLLS